MYCTDCGTAILPAAKFCAECGSKLAGVETPVAAPAAAESCPPAAPASAVLLPLIPSPTLPPAEAKKSPVAAPTPIPPPKPPGKESTAGKVPRTIFGVVLIALIFFGVVGTVLKILDQIGSAARGQFGPEHAFLVVIVVMALVWVVKKIRK